MMSLEQDLENSRKAEANLADAYMTKRRRAIYFALEEFDFTWDVDEVTKFDAMWNDGMDIRDIADELKRLDEEVGILVMDRVRKGKVKPRKNGPLTSPANVINRQGLTKEIFVKLRSEGYTQTKIREMYNIPSSTLRAWLLKWGVR